MDFFDPNKKRLKLKKIFIMYVVVGIGIVFSSLVLLYITFGYKVDSKTGQITQNGLIFINSSPVASDIYLNGKPNGSTDSRLTVPEGQYTIELKKTGYRSWKKTLNLGGSKIIRLIYPKIIPSKLEPSVTKEYIGSPTFSTNSLDRRWIVISTPGTFNNFDVFDTSKPEDPALNIEIPKTIYTTAVNPATEKIKLVEWASDNKHFIIKHFYDDKSEFIMINKDAPETSLNMNKFYNLNPLDIVLRDKKADQYYIHKDDLSLSSATTKNNELTPVIQNVSAYKPNQQKMIIYSINDPLKPDRTTVKIINDQKSYTLGEFNKSEMFVEIVQFDTDWYAAVLSKTDGKLYIFKNPIQSLDAQPKLLLKPFKTLTIATPTKLSFSSNARFVMAQNSTNLALYDFEMDASIGYKLEKPLEPEQFANWMDGHRILLNYDNKVQFIEFDNTNKNVLVPIIKNSDAFFDRDYNRIFTLSTSKTNPSNITLTRTSLKVGLKN